MQKKTALTRQGSLDRDVVDRQPWTKGVVTIAAALGLWGAALNAQALALGAISVRSALGEPLRAEIEVPDISSQEAASFTASVASPQAFRAAGVDYTPALAGARVSLHRRPNGQAYLRVTGERPINEPFLGLVIETTSSSGRVVRDYTMLIDPPDRAAPAPVAVNPPQVAAVTAPAPVAAAPAPLVVAAPAVVQAPAARPPAVRRGAASTDAPRRRAAAEASTGDGAQVTVQRGDTASAIAAAHAVDGVSLDQMLIALLRANPNAFIGGNVNRMKAGAVLNLPSADQAAATPRQAARRAVAAQTRDFHAYRRGLAQRSGATRTAAASRSASGGVQPQVQESRPAAPAKDRLTLSRGGAPSGNEAKVARSRQAQEQTARVAELNKNISELSRLQAASGSAPAGSSPVPGVAVPVGAPAKPPVPPAAATAAPAVAASATAPAAAPAASAAGSTPAVAAISAPSVGASGAATAVTEPVPAVAAPASATASATPSARATPPAPAPAPAPIEEPSFFDSVTDNPMLPVAGAGLLALLAGYGIYRSRQRKKARLDSSFMSSRLQPDSFFGASGGQRVNTKEGGSSVSGSSFMAYSPSQLDAAGDVDPVAEADVYLAYGRDMQAEEILREALRMQPQRVAIHRKLAEIYFKRRDARGLQAIATEAHGLTKGQQSADWLAIASLGKELDPSNPLYQPGGAPMAVPAPVPMRNTFGADTQPPGGHGFDDLTTPRAAPVAAPAPVPPPTPIVAPASGAASAAAAAMVGGASAMALRSPPPAVAAAPAPVLQSVVTPEFDLDLDFAPPSELGLVKAPLPKQAALTPLPPVPPVDSNLIDFDLDALSPPGAHPPGDARTRQPDDADEDPLGTKLALAQEFHAIGDTEGARALLKEVIAESSGVVRTKAERFLSELG